MSTSTVRGPSPPSSVRTFSGDGCHQRSALSDSLLPLVVLSPKRILSRIGPSLPGWASGSPADKPDRPVRDCASAPSRRPRRALVAGRGRGRTSWSTSGRGRRERGAAGSSAGASGRAGAAALRLTLDLAGLVVVADDRQRGHGDDCAVGGERRCHPPRAGPIRATSSRAITLVMPCMVVDAPRREIGWCRPEIKLITTVAERRQAGDRQRSLRPGAAAAVANPRARCQQMTGWSHRLASRARTPSATGVPP
jgi:hypothetical protein